ncbi:ribonuclease D [Testudinibacter aquarius]|uniref:Ribonuclease D n=1 Tax=Testudinibacter aquarius TaxID=1524974 RepID=A0A4R3Y7S8_9PAST|nr:ribonuclease D [Testudinibacter aquarius]KAE9530152.1 ribonuclease D [Testudinibacter aquarius]TCV86614.1 ribonuclease D [Testudinibacter aquarius]TNG91321.1 ribonuclease D [Testudinibacter aquarius]
MQQQNGQVRSVLNYQWVDSAELLQTVCDNARKKAVVALDTEFIRTRTFYPKLGLIQLYDGERLSLIDPLSLPDLAPFRELLADQAVTKVLHSCSEDLEVFQYYFKQLPQPMLDTQIIADFLGFSTSSGFAKLVQHFFDLELDKGASRTDWLARPLSEQQLQYAAADVWYLLPLFEKMQPLLAQTEWQSAVVEECEFLLKRAQQPNDPENAYLKIGNAWRLHGERLLSLKWLAKWRMRMAIERDLALNFVVKEQALYQAAESQVKHTAEFLDLGFHPNEIRRHGKKILQIIALAQKVEADQYPPAIEQIATLPRYKSTLRALQHKASEICPPELSKEQLASRKLLHQLIKWVWTEQSNPEKLPRLLQGWRKPYGQQLLSLLQTETSR